MPGNVAGEMSHKDEPTYALRVWHELIRMSGVPSESALPYAPSHIATRLISDRCGRRQLCEAHCGNSNLRRWHTFSSAEPGPEVGKVGEQVFGIAQ